jgi:hypothetical protein
MFLEGAGANKYKKLVLLEIFANDTFIKSHKFHESHKFRGA